MSRFDWSGGLHGAMVRSMTMATEPTSGPPPANGRVKDEIRAAGERDYVPAGSLTEDADGGGADLVRAAEGVGLFHTLADTGYTAKTKRGKNGNGKNGNGNGTHADAPEIHDAWLQDALMVIDPDFSPP